MNQIIPAFFSMVINLATFLLFLRFFAQFADLKRYDPFVAPFYKATGIVDLFSNIFPDLAKGRLSTSALILLFLLVLLSIWGGSILAGYSLTPIQLLIAGTFGFVLKFISACQWLLIAMVIVSWIIMLTQNMHPLFSLVMQMSEPIIAPFRRISPDLGMLDISPMIAIFAFWMLEEIISTVMNSMVAF